MHKHILICFLMFCGSSVFGQTIEELEYDLSWYSSSEGYGNKIDKARKLQQLDPFNYKAAEYIFDYYRKEGIDSIKIYFDHLIATFPNNPEPYLLRAELLYFEHDKEDVDGYIKQEINYLQSAFHVKPLDYRAVFMLADRYYDDFIYSRKKEKSWGIRLPLDEDSTLIRRVPKIRRSVFEHSADSALVYFYKLWEVNSEKRDIIYYPIKQLECYLGRLDKSKINKEATDSFEQCFFPSWYFANLGKDWECDSTINYLSEIESSKGTAEWLKIQLTNLKEECLFNASVPPSATTYRFTWLRSFHQPISVRIEKTEKEIRLYWKVGKGAGGDEPKALKKASNRKLTLDDWANFQKLLFDSGFESLPNKEYVLMTDGATWTLERKSSNDFKVHNTNSPSQEFKEACLFLIKKAGIRIKEDEIY